MAAQVLRRNPSLEAKQKKTKKQNNSAHWNLIWKKYIYLIRVCPCRGRSYILKKGTAVGLKYWTLSSHKGKLNASSLANLFLGQTCWFTNAACLKKIIIQKQYCQLRATIQRVITTVYCFIYFFYYFIPVLVFDFWFVQNPWFPDQTREFDKVKGDTFFEVFVLLAKRVGCPLLCVSSGWHSCA